MRLRHSKGGARTPERSRRYGEYPAAVTVDCQYAEVCNYEIQPGSVLRPKLTTKREHAKFSPPTLTWAHPSISVAVPCWICSSSAPATEQT